MPDRALRFALGVRDSRSLAVALTNIGRNTDPCDIVVWDVASASKRLALHGHAASVNGVVFTPDGALVSTGADKTIRVWDLRSRTAGAR
jgi:WD40 repeat protein